MAPRNILIALGLAVVAVALILVGAVVITSRAGSDLFILAGVALAVGAVLSLAHPSDGANTDGADGDEGADDAEKAGSADRTGRSRRP
ncbi:hypothetical protein [Parafrankia sp. EUN1f]|uniref:hypothetical protein n=1 Tax=Parafrankia sp. EUN1f TaxID=102897 RepID=UPI0001C477E3|nr:hypothetical protein [Parafrankia sp. EUN1f]EFC79630.1 hypothetical protein FrEUN1fDRAFT_7245 [Parafrankia sp. EUN1f]